MQGRKWGPPVDTDCSRAWMAARTSPIFLPVLPRISFPGPVSRWVPGPRTRSGRLLRRRNLRRSPVPKARTSVSCGTPATPIFLVQTAGMVPRPGEIVDTQGRRVGTHEGLHRYTIGQRRGINCPASRPYYVIRIDTRRNRLVVGFKEERYTSHCRVRNINWIAEAPDGPLAVDTRIRYRHRAAASTVTPDEKGSATVRFDEPQSSVTPGQGAVFYRGEEVVGGGWIQTADS